MMERLFFCLINQLIITFLPTLDVIQKSETIFKSKILVPYI